MFYLYLVYVEVNNYYFSTISSSRKIKEYFTYIYLFNQNELLKKESIFFFNKIKNKYVLFMYSLLDTKKKNFYKETFYENKAKIKIVGRGWKIVKFPFELLIKLGYSHPIIFTLNPYVKYKLKKKKKKYYVFYGVSYEKVNTIMGKFNFMRIPDVYTRKGIFHRKIIL
jgi:ribosomal protein L6P/L9E